MGAEEQVVDGGAITLGVGEQLLAGLEGEVRGGLGRGGDRAATNADFALDFGHVPIWVQACKIVIGHLPRRKMTGYGFDAGRQHGTSELEIEEWMEGTDAHFSGAQQQQDAGPE